MWCAEHDRVRDDRAVAVLVAVEAVPAILIEFAGCEHLVDGVATVDEVRPAPGSTANSGPSFAAAAARFAEEIAAECGRRVGADGELAVERVDFVSTDRLRA